MSKRTVHLWRSDRRKEKSLRLLGWQTGKGNIQGETSEGKSCLGKNCYVDVSCLLWADKSLELSPVIKNHLVLPGRKFFLCLLFLSCFHVKIILLLECHILEWRTLNSTSSVI